MARQQDLNSHLGKHGKLIYDKKKNAFFLKVETSALKKVSKKEKEKRNLKEGNFEFGGGSVLSKVFRDKFASVLSSYNDRALAGRLTGVFRSIIKRGSGVEGMRKAELRKNKELLEGFEFHKGNVFENIFRPALSWQVKKGRKKISLIIPGFSIKGKVSMPKGASHFQITLAAAILSDYHYSKRKKKYLPLTDSFDGEAVLHSSDFIPLKGSAEEIQISIILKSELPDTCALIVCTGIQFYKEEAMEMYSLETKKALQVSKVF